MTSSGIYNFLYGYNCSVDICICSLYITSISPADAKCYHDRDQETQLNYNLPKQQELRNILFKQGDSIGLVWIFIRQRIYTATICSV